MVNDMREILFKAKTEKIVRTYNNRLDDGVWVQGYLRCDCGMWLIYQFEYDRADQVAYEVNPETVCQFTGLHDKNGRKIWENDIVSEDFRNYKGVIRFGEFESLELKNVGFNIEWYGGIYYRQDLTYWADKCEIIGSAIDNPELLKGCL